MAAAEQYSGTVGKYRLVFNLAPTRYIWITLILLLLTPVVAYATGDSTIMFYTHVTIGAFWLGLDFFFKYIMAPAMDASGPETAMSLTPNLTPRVMIAGEGATLGTIGSGIFLAHRLGYLSDPSIFIWGALAGAIIMIIVAFVPLHHYQSEMLVELESEEPDGPRIGQLSSSANIWAQFMTVMMLFMILMMTGLRGFLQSPF